MSGTTDAESLLSFIKRQVNDGLEGDSAVEALVLIRDQIATFEATWGLSDD